MLSGVHYEDLLETTRNPAKNTRNHIPGHDVGFTNFEYLFWDMVQQLSTGVQMADTSFLTVAQSYKVPGMVLMPLPKFTIGNLEPFRLILLDNFELDFVSVISYQSLSLHPVTIAS